MESLLTSENRPSLVKSLGELLLVDLLDKLHLSKYGVTLADLIDHFDPAHHSLFESKMA